MLNNDWIALSHPDFKAFQYKDLSPNEAHGLPDEISQNYYVGRKLGAGACGIVRLVYDRYTCEPYAMKQIQKNVLAPSTATTDFRRIMNEVLIMRELQHPCVIKMHNIINTPTSVFILLELMKGGDLLARICGNRHLSERISKLFFIQMCHAVKYLHDRNITHRDLKPDNILLESDAEETVIRVSDFGLSKMVQNESVMRTVCGTPLYVAPEVLLTGGRGAYTKKVDIWSLGVVLFTCLSGTLPFSDAYGSAASEQIKKGKFSFRAAVWRTVSPIAKSLIKSMLTVKATQRMSIDDVLQHKWLQDEEVLAKAEQLMKLKLPTMHLNASVAAAAAATVTVAAATVAVSGDEENFVPPAIKRRRIEL